MTRDREWNSVEVELPHEDDMRSNWVASTVICHGCTSPVEALGPMAISQHLGSRVYINSFKCLREAHAVSSTKTDCV